MSLPRRPAADRRRRRAFTLTEVLIALGILAIGLVSVASLFPAGLLMQKEAVDATLRQSHIRSMDAILTGMNLDNGVLLRFTELVESGGSAAAASRSAAGVKDPIFDVFAVAEVDSTIDGSSSPPSDVANTTDVDGATPNGSMTAASEYEAEDSYLASFPLGSRCLPTATPPAPPPSPVPAGYDPNYAFREVYWVPLIRRGLEASELYADWSVYAFVLQPPGDLRDSGGYAFGSYPSYFTDEVCANPYDPSYFPKVFRLEVENVPDDESEAEFKDPAILNMAAHVKVGDPVLGDNGTIYTITRVSGRVVGLNADRNYLPLNQRDLRALWLAPTLDGGDNSPVAEVRLLSNAVVRVNSSL
ncbi:type IV pilus modification PilV family protein [Phycisphaera mikurensis]|uniref:Prepilin-type N-terminal cleavage/methylation domain-containing protein n=1 Tax=Phycisphaera mikurensis (strain NBRC 102666 / KCTC 22515 / FYK2301M01) TaxID=1142394 RepID=I0IFZ7_PHYMF|nr:prepilin-type N-terminal cleavage/methylation domain-containing protein [Phycisphaera mikurensis]MBB6440429.1 prepilin-type N-terminal cleavage/methylation domain-containing protein [Phycisphaera mikurensis]BAM04185.1 hypothetical protein PSMK_20260 [Phycisphaera mikurensis NBRC 102666]